MPQKAPLGSDRIRTWDELPDHVDVLIVGGGLAGLELAKHLELSGAEDVLVAEAGAHGDLDHVYAANDAASADTIWTDETADEYFVQLWNSVTEPHFSRGSGIRRRLGGRSLYWHGVLLPVEEWALADPAWPESVVKELTDSWQHGPSLYARVRADLTAWSERARWRTPVGESVEVGRFRLVEPPRAVRQADAEGARWEAYSPLSHWLETVGGESAAAASAGSVRIATDVEIMAVLVSGGTAQGVAVRHRVSGEQKRITARKVVLAAGTVESTRLAVQALHQAGRLPQSRLTGLVDHIVQGFNVTLPADSVPQWLRRRAHRSVFAFAPGSGPSRSNLFIQLDPTTEGDLRLEAWVTGEQIRSAQGVVSCTAGDTWPWPVTISTGLDTRDILTVEAQRDELQQFWSDWCAEFGLKPGPLEFDSDFLDPSRTLRSVRDALRNGGWDAAEGRPVTWSSPLGTEEHEGGTLAIGDVLDERQEFIGLTGLFAVGPATIPRQGAANPSMTTLALSRRLAALLME
ncbi:GMC family oxidoreductase [Streptomyces sp. NPDC056161]|uniref:GMC family oxidoreductase n=1 Tax=Streptomyces sp. NPDC056161 TaxID=3345732 RepID=UPI0035DFE330